MSDLVRRKNRLIQEGQNLAQGRPSTMTAEEWLRRYDEIDEEDFIGAQREIVKRLHALIERKRNSGLAAGSAAV